MSIQTSVETLSLEEELALVAIDYSVKQLDLEVVAFCVRRGCARQVVRYGTSCSACKRAGISSENLRENGGVMHTHRTLPF